jgi:sodium/hydrogen antiporter
VTLLLLFVGLIFAHALVSGRLARTPLTAPMLFTTAGLAVGLVFPASAPDGGNHLQFLLTLAEVGLVLLLFTDASKTSRAALKAAGTLPVRLLSVGMLLTVGFGMLAALWIFPGLSVWEAGILAAILAPTDAGLGQVIVNSRQVPLRIRQSLNIEAGLNDGLAVPFLLFFIALAVHAGDGDAGFGHFLYEQLGWGALIGIVVGAAGGLLLGVSHRREWIAESWVQLGVVALPVLCLLASAGAGASAFIAAFVAGIAVQFGFRQAGSHSVAFTEDWGQLLNLAVFFLFGLFVAGALGDLTWSHVLYGVLSLTVLRMLPVALAALGAGLSRATVLFMGWFGPRGLASIVLGLVYLEHARAGHATLDGDATIRLAVIATVLLSIYLHGATALPGTRHYARRLAALPPSAPDAAVTDTVAPAATGAPR